MMHFFDILGTSQGWMYLFILSVLEIVLGIDNIIFISIVTDKLPKENKLSETNTEKKDLNSSSETDNHKQIFADGDLYKKSWQKLNSIHKILKVKEFVNNLKMNSEKDKIKLKDKLVELIKEKKLTKKENVIYDEINGKIISLPNLQYKDGNYFYLEN